MKVGNNFNKIKYLHEEYWRTIKGFTFIEMNNSAFVLRYCGGSIVDVIKAIRQEEISKKHRMYVIIRARKHTWTLDYLVKNGIEKIQICRSLNLYCLHNNVSKKTSRFYGVFYRKSYNGNRHWIAFHYKPDERRKEGRNVQRIGRYSSEHEAAVAHDAYMLWWKQPGRLNYNKMKSPKTVEELQLLLTPKEEIFNCYLTRPDCYLCQWHRELSQKALVECKVQNSDAIPYDVATIHGWWQFPIIDPLWLQSCTKFKIKGEDNGIQQKDKSKEGESKEESIVSKKRSGRLSKEEISATEHAFKGDVGNYD
jgi:hypothetical protein